MGLFSSIAGAVTAPKVSPAQSNMLGALSAQEFLVNEKFFLFCCFFGFNFIVYFTFCSWFC